MNPFPVTIPMRFPVRFPMSFPMSFPLRFPMRFVGLLLALSIVSATSLLAGQLSPKEEDRFETHVRSVLVAHGIECHEGTKQQSGLWLTSLAEVLTGGESGSAIVPGKPEESPLLEALRYESFEMLPDESTVVAAQTGHESDASLVDRFHDDPADGENPARSWLDLVRDAEPHGDRADHARPERIDQNEGHVLKEIAA